MIEEFKKEIKQFENLHISNLDESSVRCGKFPKEYVWYKRYLKLSEEVAKFSKDPSTKVGAFIVRPDWTCASFGYNGFPKTMKDSQKYLDDREEKYSRVIHAEINALTHMYENCYGYRLITYPLIPCDRCSVQIIQSGITEIISILPNEDQLSRWHDSLIKSLSYFDECGVKINLCENYS